MSGHRSSHFAGEDCCMEGMMDKEWLGSRFWSQVELGLVTDSAASC